MKILLVVFPEPGQLHPFVGIAQRLVRSGHTVAVFSTVDVTARLAAAGLDCPTFQSGGGLRSASGGGSPRHRSADFAARLSRPDWARNWYRTVLLSSVPRQVDALRSAVREWHPDVLCADSMSYAAAIVGALEGIPWAGVSAMLLPLAPDGWRCPFTDVIEGLAPEREQLFASYGVTGRFKHNDVISPWFNTVFTTEAFVPRARTSNDFSRYVGPSLPAGRRGDEPEFPFERLSADRPLVYVAFGSQVSPPTHVITDVAHALGPSEADIVISLSDLARQRLARPLPAHVISVPYAPQLALLDRAAVMVGHGGANSVAECLSWGRPMLVVPLTTDQPLQALFVEESGAGAALAPHDVTGARVREVLRSLIEADGSARRHANTIAESYAGHSAPARIAELLLDAPATARPRRRAARRGATDEQLRVVSTGLSSSPATTPQEFFWTMALDDPDASAYYMPAGYVITGALDRDALQRSLCTLVGAHSVYRTAIREVDGELRQVVLSPEDAPTFELELRDLSPLPESEWHAEIRRTVAEFVARGFDLERGRVLWARLTELAPERHALVVVFHHIATDFGASNRFFLRLWQLYEAARRGETLSETAPVQYVDVGDAIARWPQTPAGKVQADYWRARLQDAPAVQLPLDLPREEADRRRGAARRGLVADPMHPAETLTLAEDVREGLTRLARKHRVTIYGMYLSGLAWLLHTETGQTDVCIESSVDMRAHDPGLADVHGPLSSWTVLRVDLSGCETFADVIPRAGQAVADAKRHGPIHDYYRLVPHTARRVVFNYVLARWGRGMSNDQQGLRMERCWLPFPRWKRPWDLHLTIMDADAARFTWTGNERLFRKEAGSMLLQRYLQILETETRGG